MENNMAGRLEAVLFAAGEPLEIDKTAQAMEIDENEVIALFEQLKNDYDKRGAGIMLLRLGNKLQMCTRKEYFDTVRAVLEIKRNAPLSQAAFEVLAVIAYNQPVTKSFIEQVRGVDCSGVVSSLCEKGLIEEQGRLDLPGRPLLYGTTDSFMRCFGLSSLADLPPIPHDETEGEENDGDEDNDSAANSDSGAVTDESGAGSDSSADVGGADSDNGATADESGAVDVGENSADFDGGADNSDNSEEIAD